MPRTVASKITPGMVNWCRALSDQDACRLLKRTVPQAPNWQHYRTEGPLRIAKPTWAMVDKLMAAGLISWTKRREHDFIAHLTVAGLAEAAHEQAPVIVKGEDAWPFPSSSRFNPDGSAKASPP
ncbi:MAG: hypothetical protein AB7P99_13155 [Vicinamibacterales bacterium]|uniref:hypothetical protein n=1 Tax=Ramlibacter sp. TaxID=1917967 RepID=UPI003D11F55B